MPKMKSIIQVKSSHTINRSVVYNDNHNDNNYSMNSDGMKIIS